MEERLAVLCVFLPAAGLRARSIPVVAHCDLPFVENRAFETVPAIGLKLKVL
jgi:hypothetical protein